MFGQSQIAVVDDDRANLESVKPAGDRADPGEPLHVGHAVPARHHEAERRAVLGRQRHVVHLVGQQDVLSHALLNRQAALVILLDAPLDTVVGSGEDHLDGVVAETRAG